MTTSLHKNFPVAHSKTSTELLRERVEKFCTMCNVSQIPPTASPPPLLALETPDGGVKWVGTNPDLEIADFEMFALRSFPELIISHQASAATLIAHGVIGANDDGTGGYEAMAIHGACDEGLCVVAQARLYRHDGGARLGEWEVQESVVTDDTPVPGTILGMLIGLFDLDEKQLYEEVWDQLQAGQYGDIA